MKHYADIKGSVNEIVVSCWPRRDNGLNLSAWLGRCAFNILNVQRLISTRRSFPLLSFAYSGRLDGPSSAGAARSFPLSFSLACITFQAGYDTAYLTWG